MSKINELISELCPDGVPVSQLGDVAEVQRGISISRSDVTEGPVPVLAGGQQPSCWHNESNRGGENVVVAGSGAYAGFVSHWMGPIWVSDSFSISGRSNFLLTKFCFYMLKNRQDELHQMKRGSGVPHVYAKDFAKLFIPVPPIEVQREIVSILDKFTQLEAELEAELEARRRQQSHYRSSVLALGDNAKEVALGDIAEFKYGFTATAADQGEFRFFRITDITPAGKLSPESAKYVETSAAAREYIVQPGDLLMARTGATYGKTMLADSGEPAVYASFLIRIRVDESVMLPSYYWHFAQSEQYWSQANAMVSTGGQPQFNANVLKLILVPVPSLDQQRAAVAILDKFDALANDLSSGIPAELAARRKQYEHYRNKLLAFKELETA